VPATGQTQRAIRLLAGVALWGCSSPPATAPAAAPGPEPGPVASNVLRGDYAGSEECAPCHPAIYRAWRESPMHRMTRNAGEAEVRAPFAGETFHFKGDRATMETRAGQRFLRLYTRADGESLHRITRIIGGRFREDYAGVDVTGADDPVTATPRGEERVMPVSYVYATRSYRYKGYSVLVEERPRMQVGGVWRTTCIFCHNTVPYLSTLYDDLLDDRKGGYQGSMQNDLVPASRRWQVTAVDVDGLVRALGVELDFLGDRGARNADLPDALARAIRVTRDRFGPEHFVEVGIGCEACHGGSREHADDPRRRPSFQVRSDVVAEVPAGAAREPSRAEAINRTCMRCHTVLFSRYPHTWEGGHRYQNPGGSSMNSGEARDFVLGGCAQEMACTACHDPHGPDDPAAMKALEGPAGRTLCTSCHPDLASRDAIAAHTHHDPDGAGSSCIGCHMPRKNLGLAYDLTRYHRIGSPTDRARVEKDRPLECALCHPDASVKTLVTTMQRWWGHNYDLNRVRGLYGPDLEVNALHATVTRGKPHEQIVAIAVLGRSGDRDAAPLLAALLDHAYPLVRHVTAQALANLLGQWPEVDLDAESAVIREQARGWLDTQLGPP
jgi:predicted CXXCH cytochrome family protein